jgi:hypothetical protein
MTPIFSISSDYAGTDGFDNAIALLFLSWSFLFLLFAIVGTKTNVVLLWIFISVTMTAAFVSASHFTAAMHNNPTAINLQKVLVIRRFKVLYRS